MRFSKVFILRSLGLSTVITPLTAKIPKELIRLWLFFFFLNVWLAKNETQKAQEMPGSSYSLSPSYRKYRAPSWLKNTQSDVCLDCHMSMLLLLEIKDLSSKRAFWQKLPIALQSYSMHWSTSMQFGLYLGRWQIQSSIDLVLSCHFPYSLSPGNKHEL